MLRDQITASKRKRYEILKLLYEKSNADPSQYIEDEELQKELGTTPAEFLPMIMELDSNGFVKMTQQATAISFPGIHEVERVESNPNRGTAYFPAMNVMYVGQISNSPIQQGTYQSSQSVQLSGGDVQPLMEFIRRLEEVIGELNLNSDDKMQAQAEIATVKAQTSAARPSRAIIRESISSLRRILEGAAGGAAGARANDWLGELINIIATL